MSNNNENIKEMTVRRLLEDGEYVIPIYQRNYDWGEREAKQLVEDIADYASLHADSRYYIGSLVAFPRHRDGHEYYETIDGQQRMTTLTILMSALKELLKSDEAVNWFEHANLHYDHREEADETIRTLVRDGKKPEAEIASGIKDVYELFVKNVPTIIGEKDGLTMKAFVEYLLENVIVLRILVPKDTQLNHYFEIMNSRGEQLEKHEVLKASLMCHIPQDCHRMFNEIWEACSDMNKYVELSLRSAVRRMVFGDDWMQSPQRDFDTLWSKYCCNTTNDLPDYKAKHTIEELMKDAKDNKYYPLPDEEQEDENPDRFGTIINFPNFLLHVLKITCHNQIGEAEDNIVLDDKHLLDVFAKVIASHPDRQAFAKRFIMELLYVRWLFDRYVIKVNNNKGGWSLKRLKKYQPSKYSYVSSFNDDRYESEDDDDETRVIRMMEAMFHISAPTQIYKYWLNAVLWFVYDNKDISAKDMRLMLENLAKAYMCDRYLCKQPTLTFFDIIYSNNCEAQNKELNWESINQGCKVENFIFNFYDFLLWNKLRTRKTYATFEFTYRTSVEHFYPQHPSDGNKVLTEEDGLNDFGNLCLISRGMNSKFTNNMPKAKADNFGNDTAIKELSIKLSEMIQFAKNSKWGVKEIAENTQAARELLSASLLG